MKVILLEGEIKYLELLLSLKVEKRKINMANIIRVLISIKTWIANKIHCYAGCQSVSHVNFAEI